MNHSIMTVLIAPMTTKSKSYPSRVPLSFQNKDGRIVLDQIRTVDKKRLIKKIGSVGKQVILEVKSVLQEMLVDLSIRLNPIKYQHPVQGNPFSFAEHQGVDVQLRKIGTNLLNHSTYFA